MKKTLKLAMSLALSGAIFFQTAPGIFAATPAELSAMPLINEGIIDGFHDKVFDNYDDSAFDGVSLYKNQSITPDNLTPEQKIASDSAKELLRTALSESEAFKNLPISEKSLDMMLHRCTIVLTHNMPDNVYAFASSPKGLLVMPGKSLETGDLSRWGPNFFHELAHVLGIKDDGVAELFASQITGNPRKDHGSSFKYSGMHTLYEGLADPNALGPEKFWSAVTGWGSPDVFKEYFSREDSFMTYDEFTETKNLLEALYNKEVPSTTFASFYDAVTIADAKAPFEKTYLSAMKNNDATDLRKWLKKYNDWQHVQTAKEKLRNFFEHKKFNIPVPPANTKPTYVQPVRYTR